MPEKVLIIVGDATETVDTLYPFYRLIEGGYEPVVAAPEKRLYQMVMHENRPGWTITKEWEGYQIEARVAFSEIDPDDYLGIFFSGGRAPEYIRDDEDLIRVTRHFFDKNKPIASVCHGVEIPARADRVRGRKMATVPKCQFDLEICGGTFVNEACVIDGNLVSGRTFHDHGHYMGAWMALLDEARGAKKNNGSVKNRGIMDYWNSGTLWIQPAKPVPRLHHSTIPLFLFVTASVLFSLPSRAPSHPAHAESVNYPFVIGFERFYAGDDDPEYLAEGGLLLLNELNCVACHTPPDSLKQQLSGRTATNLAGVGSRLSPLDLELFIRNPRFVKQDTIMPSFFAGPDRDLKEVEALKHFLAFLKSEGEPPKEKGDLEAGRRLYHRIGCVACHAPEVSYRPDDLPEGIELELTGLPSVPMNLADKYDDTGLVRFLLDPLTHRPSGRMPDFKLEEQEAADLAAYLKSGPKPEIPEELKAQFEAANAFEIDMKKVGQGMQLFASKNCIACHANPGLADAATQRSKPLAQLNADPKNRRGCLSERPQGGTVPAFFLDEVQKKAIEFALAKISEAPTLDRDGRIDWTMTTLNCYACHERGGKGAPETAREPYFAVNEVGALSLGRWGNIPPPLDKVGRKLTDRWFDRILFNRGGDGEVRHYMEARMPVFQEKDLRPWLADVKEADVRDPPIEIDVTGLPRYQRGHYGRDLLGVNGLGCVTCHGVKDRKSLGAPVINLTHTVERLQPAYFKESLLDPQGTQPGTLMPPLFQERKKADQEVEQIWTYLKEIDQRRVPDGLLKTDDFELKPEKAGRPIVFRTFLEGVGTQAIAVGFPEGVHAAFDSRECRWRIAWRGRFLDAMSTWDDRFCAPAEPLGEAVTDLAEQLPGPKTEAEFLGFRLDEKGVPTFLYETGGERIEDRIEPDGDGLKRIVNGKSTQLKLTP